MVREHAVLNVRAGLQGDFEAAFQGATALISATPGFISLQLGRCLEDPQRYLLLVEWEQLEDHTVGFRESAAYQQWRAALHHFYEPFPTVDHYEPLLGC